MLMRVRRISNNIMRIRRGGGGSAAMRVVVVIRSKAVVVRRGRVKVIGGVGGGSKRLVWVMGVRARRLLVAGIVGRRSGHLVFNI